MGGIITGVGKGMSYFSKLSKANIAESHGKSEAAMMRMQASQLDIDSIFTGMQADLHEYNAKKQIAYSEYLLGAGKYEEGEIKRQGTRIMRIMQESQASAIGSYRASSANRGVAMSGSALQNLEEIQSDSEKKIADAQYEVDAMSSKALIESQLKYANAQSDANNQQLTSQMLRTKANAMRESSAFASKMLNRAAKDTEWAGTAGAWANRLDLGASVLGDIKGLLGK